MQEGKKPIFCEGSMKNVNKDTFTGFAYIMFNFFFLRLQKMLVAFLGNRLHHKLSPNLLKRC